MTDKEKTKLCSKRRRTGLHRVNVWMDDRAVEHLEAIKSDYGALLNRPVANSIIIRRALALLALYLRKGLPDEQAVWREVVTLARHAG